MSIQENAEEFAGLPVLDYAPDEGIENPAGVIYRLRLDYDASEAGETMTGLLARFLEDPRAGEISGLVIGSWEDPPSTSAQPIIEALVAARERLVGLRALFLGDITSEECEISWIRQSDVTPLLDAYPDLEHFQVRGGSGLLFGTIRHEGLRSLVVESGGLDAEVVRGVAASDFPRLNHLEFWLGSDNYGATATVEDLAPILAGDRLPVLRYLGLRDSELADAVAIAAAQAPILGRLRVLDLSLGTLSDEGAQALLASPGVAGLEKLDLHHHFLPDETIAKLEALPIEVDVSDQQLADEDDGETYRYVAVGE